MESLFDDYAFGGDFSELGDKKFDPSKREDANTSNVLFDFGKTESSKSSNELDILSDISYSKIKSEPISRSTTAFDESEFKYLLNKSPVDNEPKKSSKNKKESEEEEREKMQYVFHIK